MDWTHAKLLFTDLFVTNGTLFGANYFLPELTRWKKFQRQIHFSLDETTYFSFNSWITSDGTSTTTSHMKTSTIIKYYKLYYKFINDIIR